MNKYEAYKLHRGMNTADYYTGRWLEVDELLDYFIWRSVNTDWGDRGETPEEIYQRLQSAGPREIMSNWGTRTG